MEPTKEQEREEEKQRESFCPPIAGEYTTTLLMMVILSPPMLLYPSKILIQRDKNFILVIAYSALFNKVFEALNLILEK